MQLRGKPSRELDPFAVGRRYGLTAIPTTHQCGAPITGTLVCGLHVPAGSIFEPRVPDVLRYHHMFSQASR